MCSVLLENMTQYSTSNVHPMSRNSNWSAREYKGLIAVNVPEVSVEEVAAQGVDASLKLKN